MPKATLALFAVCLALGAAGCAPTLRFNQSYLVAEDMKVTDKGYAALKSTGETFDLTPIRTAEGRADHVTILKVHGTYFVTGEGFKNLWRLWPGGDDEVHYKPVDDVGGKSGVFSGVTLEPAEKCAHFTFTKGAMPSSVYVTTGGDVDTKRCPDA